LIKLGLQVIHFQKLWFWMFRFCFIIVSYCLC